VIDAGALIKPALASRLSDLESFRLHAPTLLWSEAASALKQLSWRGEITVDESNAALARILGHPIAIVPSRELVERATAIARQLGWAKTYDAEYLALAEQLGIRLLTNDARLRATTLVSVDVVGPLEILGT
jgi:predicted nucleic acid-binding protein